MANFDWSKVTKFTIPEGTVSSIKNAAGEILWQADQSRSVQISFGAGVAQATVSYTTASGTATSKVLYWGNHSQLPESLSGGSYAISWYYSLGKVKGSVSVTINTYFDNYSRPSGWTSDTTTSSSGSTVSVSPTLGSIQEVTGMTSSSRYSYYHIGGSYDGGSGAITQGDFHDMSTSFMEILSRCSTSPSDSDTYYQLIRSSSVANKLFANGAPVFKLKTSVLASSALYVRPTYSDSSLVNGLTLNPASGVKAKMRVPALTWQRYYNTVTYDVEKISTSDTYIFLLKLGTAIGNEWKVAWPSNSIVDACPDATTTQPITQLSLSYRPDGDDYYYQSTLKYFVSYFPSTNNGTNNYYCANGIWYDSNDRILSTPPPIGSPVAITGLVSRTNSWSDFAKYFYSNYDTTSPYHQRYIYGVWSAGWVYDP